MCDWWVVQISVYTRLIIITESFFFYSTPGACVFLGGIVMTVYRSELRMVSSATKPFRSSVRQSAPSLLTRSILLWWSNWYLATVQWTVLHCEVQSHSLITLSRNFERLATRCRTLLMPCCCCCWYCWCCWWCLWGARSDNSASQDGS